MLKYIISLLFLVAVSAVMACVTPSDSQDKSPPGPVIVLTSDYIYTTPASFNGEAITSVSDRTDQAELTLYTMGTAAGFIPNPGIEVSNRMTYLRPTGTSNLLLAHVNPPTTAPDIVSRFGVQ